VESCKNAFRGGTKKGQQKKPEKECQEHEEANSRAKDIRKSAWGEDGGGAGAKSM